MASTKILNRFEANLMTILQFLLRRDTEKPAFKLLFQARSAPTCLTRAAVTLIQDTLSKGCIEILCRSGGWQTERYLHHGVIHEGKLWQRHRLDDLRLQFSKHTLRLLIWLTSEDLAKKKLRWPSSNTLTLADQFFLLLIFDGLRNSAARPVMRGRRLFTTNVLCRLLYPDVFAENNNNPELDFQPWLNNHGTIFLEALQQKLNERWLHLERGKSQLSSWHTMQALGQTQEQVLVPFLDALEQAERRDLARFLLPTMKALLPENPQGTWWTGGLSRTGPRLADRAETNRTALVLVHQMRRLKAWEQHARTIGYFDDGYQASQLYKTDWEHWQGDVLLARAETVIREMEPFRS